MTEWLVSFLLPVFIPVLSTLAVAGAKYVADLSFKVLPSQYLPAISMLAGALLEALAATPVIPGVPTGISGAVLGLAGVGVRELVDQLRKNGLKAAI